jgi:hypothetical protein
MPGTACEVGEIADSEVEEVEGSECDIAEVGEVSAPEVATTELTVADIDGKLLFYELSTLT